ncbi:MAG: radical SAM protein [Planctomycetaceae bacterium]|nr:MAG: radical SAM protein [Planctomycetaceae bacterium]
MSLVTVHGQRDSSADAVHPLPGLSPRQSLRTCEDALAEDGLHPLRATGIEVLQVSLGKLCNMTCTHCHVDAEPTRREIMTRETAEACLAALASTDIPVLDLTGGAPEMNPHFRWLVQEARRLDRHVIDRCNLTILRAPGYTDLPEFLAAHRVEIVASLPCYLEENVDAQRGNRAFNRSIEVLRQLNGHGSRLGDDRKATD